MEPSHEEKKICRVCGKLLPLSAYNSNKQCRDGHEGTCKKCRYQKAREKILLDSLNETQKEPVKQDEPKPFPLSGPPVKTVIPPGVESQTLSAPVNAVNVEFSDQNCLISKNKSKAAHDQTDTFLPITQPSKIKTSNILKLCSIIDLLYPNGITTDQYSTVIPAILKIDQLL